MATSTIRRFNPLAEGTPESRRQAREAVMQAGRVAAARSRDWRELRPDRIERRGKLIVDTRDGAVYESVRAPVWGGGDPKAPLNEHLVDAWAVVDYDVRSTPARKARRPSMTSTGSPSSARPGPPPPASGGRPSSAPRHCGR